MMRMVDVSSFNPQISNWQEYITWSKNGGNTSGIIIRATEGTAFIDSTFEERSKEALANGVDEIWYYCYSHPEFNQVQTEVDYLWGAVKNVVRQDRDTLMLDYEQTNSQATVSYALAWLNAASYLVRKPPVFYSYLAYIQERGYASYPIIAKYPLGLAAYTGSMPGVPAPWTEALWWQNSDEGIVPGISAPVDTDIQESTESDIMDSKFTHVDDSQPGGVWRASNGVLFYGWIAQNILADLNNDKISLFLGLPQEEQHHDSDGRWRQKWSYAVASQSATNQSDFHFESLPVTPVSSIDVPGIKTLLNEALQKLG